MSDDGLVYELVMSELIALAARVAAIERAIEDLWQSVPAEAVSALSARRARDAKSLRAELAAAREERMRKVKR